ncbi:SGNH/GDSL hydrolase family protein [Arthrobacter sp. A5]|uniref:SGNH/GDSL hydrolase family protein n=1 Tax=Arthrobacter sp. A5 TaxID=576926 RepID=UPI003DA8A5B1
MPQRPPRRPEPRIRPVRLSGIAVLCLSLLAGLLLTACQPTDDGGGPATTVAVTRQQPAADTIVVLGDSISTGFQTSAEAAWPNVLVQDFAQDGINVELRNGARNGAGYVEPGDGDLPFAGQADATVIREAAVVVVYGSENDVGQDLAQIGDQVRETVAVIRRRAPDAQILLVGPAAVQDNPDEGLLAVRDTIAAAADLAGAPFVDPIQLGWFKGQEDTLIGPDGDHPSVLGHEYLAIRMEKLLRPLLPTAG